VSWTSALALRNCKTPYLHQSLHQIWQQFEHQNRIKNHELVQIWDRFDDLNLNFRQHLAQKLAFFAETTADFFSKNLSFEKSAIFSPKNWRKSLKIMILTPVDTVVKLAPDSK
jgi:hypothetical protein